MIAILSYLLMIQFPAGCHLLIKWPTHKPLDQKKKLNLNYYFVSFGLIKKEEQNSIEHQFTYSTEINWIKKKAPSCASILFSFPSHNLIVTARLDFPQLIYIVFILNIFVAIEFEIIICNEDQQMNHQKLS